MANAFISTLQASRYALNPIKKGVNSALPCQPLVFTGAGARNRTETGSPPRDFESRASTSFTTPA